MTLDSRQTVDEKALRALLSRPSVETSTATHPVHESLTQLQREFVANGGRRSGSGDSEAPPTVRKSADFPDQDLGESILQRVNSIVMPANPSEACIAPLLRMAGWSGELRRVREALPHFERVDGIESLRCVLARLGIGTLPRRVKVQDLDDSSFPALFENARGQPSIVAERSSEASYLIFDGESSSWQSVGNEELSGPIFSIYSLERDKQSSPDAQKQWLGKAVSRFKPIIAAAVALSFLVNVAALVVPFFVVHVYDLGIGTRSTETVFLLAIGAGVVICADILFRYIRARVMAYFGARIDALIGMGTFHQLMNMPISMVETAPAGVQIARLRQFESMRDAFTSTLAAALIDIPFVFIFLIAIAVWGGNLVWIPIALLLVFAVLTSITFPLIRHHIGATGDVKQRIHLLIRETVAKRQVIRDLNADSIWIDRHETLLNEWAHKNYKFQTFNSFVQNIAQALVSIAGVATLGLGTLWVMAGTMSPGALIGSMALVWRILSPLQATYLSVTRLEQALQTYRQINRLMAIETEHEATPSNSFHRSFRGHIVLNRLFFRYPRSSEPAIRGIQLAIRPGEVIAVTGRSGAGKSTLLKLLLGLYPPLGGAVLVDGLDLRQISAAEWRSVAAYLPERTHFYYGTLAQNVRLACPDVTDSEIRSALISAGVDVGSHQFPDGIETRLTHGTLESLPDSLKQGIALARCFVKKAPIYLLDNPGSNVDEVAAAAFVAKVGELRGKATIVMTTFRPAYMRLADRVVVLSDGLAIADGPPDQIIERLAAVA